MNTFKNLVLEACKGNKTVTVYYVSKWIRYVDSTIRDSIETDNKIRYHLQNNFNKKVMDNKRVYFEVDT